MYATLFWHQARKGVERVRAARRAIAVLPGAVAVVLAVAGCSGSDDPEPAASVLGDDTLTVASFAFAESEVLAEVYAQALQQAGVDTEVAAGRGARELIQPALAGGLVELVPEYAGTAVDFLSLGEVAPDTDLAATRASLDDLLRDGPVTALASAPAQDTNVVVVTRETAGRLGLVTISDLAEVADGLTFGGPPECPHRVFCLPGLQKAYDMRFERFVPLDAGGPLTHQALTGGHVDVGLLFSTDPRLAADDLVVLADDRGLQPAENVTPMVRREAVDRWGDALTGTVDGVSAQLTTDALVSLNAGVAAGRSPQDVAAEWLDAEGLA
jgi:osmoprotectant transport system substrate-binding protein